MTIQTSGDDCREIKSVWVLEAGRDYDGSEVISIHLTEQGARDAEKLVNKEKFEGWDWTTVDEYPVK